jgi:hypothetical protein
MRLGVGLMAILIGALALAGCIENPDLALDQPYVDERPDGSALVSGLATTYWYVDVHNMRQARDAMQRHPSTQGEPVPNLDGQYENGPVLTSGANDNVIASIVGFINFSQPGRYVFTANSNDGVRVEIAGRRVTEDPDAHPDRFSPPGFVDIDAPGWYPIRVLYFERRGTATLQLFWTPPGRSAPEIVPASAFRRKP